MTVLSIWQWIFVGAIAIAFRFRGGHLLAGLFVGVLIVPCAPVVLDGLLAYRANQAIKMELSRLTDDELRAGYRKPVQEVLARHGVDKEMTHGIRRERSKSGVSLFVDYVVFSPFLANANILFEFEIAVPLGGQPSEVALSE